MRCSSFSGLGVSQCLSSLPTLASGKTCGLTTSCTQNQTSTHPLPTYLPGPILSHSVPTARACPSVPTCPTVILPPNHKSSGRLSQETQQWPSSSLQRLLGPCPARPPAPALKLAPSSSLTLRGTPGPGSPLHCLAPPHCATSCGAGFWFVLSRWHLSAQAGLTHSGPSVSVY